MIKNVDSHMRNFKVELNILGITIIINRMVMENMYGLMEKAIKEIGLMERSVDMVNGLDKIPRIRVSGIMDLLKEREYINLKMVFFELISQGISIQETFCNL